MRAADRESAATRGVEGRNRHRVPRGYPVVHKIGLLLRGCGVEVERDHAVGRGVAKQKIPERLELVTELPKTQSGKVQKFRLREIIRDTLAREASSGKNSLEVG